ncbi:hypothetical protein BUALT_Bualt10G0019500 [Buddleja alternifolia]|uniref:PHD-type domain-containing protein n=1 Tax=Buddleja alternifolia TaxID=168488 RepID=A0AAV6WX68_9LAMI|nr:hypothetical protein BUALT_Bualt10G0019500 [Buddleja alternifolia]
MKSEDFIKSSTRFEMKQNHDCPLKKRVLDTEECLKCEISDKSIETDEVLDTEVPFYRKNTSKTLRERRKIERIVKKHKLSPIYRSNNTNSIGSENFENLGFSVRRKRSTKNRFTKSTAKATILSWLIYSGTIQENAVIFSVDETSKQMKNKGKIRRDGILCLCCNKIFTVTNFHLHGGRNSDKPYESIFVVKTKISLLSYMIEAWNKPEESELHKCNVIEIEGNASDLYDDACMVCADGGNLMCCEECNSTYHQVCIGLEDVPEGSWYCPYCVCKFCAKPAHEDDNLITCPQCEKRYHWECHKMREHQKLDLNRSPVAPFCERNCKKVYDKLIKSMVGKRNELDEGYSWTLLHQMDGDSEMYIDDKYLRTICHSKLVVARRLMEECFEPIQDRHTKIKVIPSVVYNCGANFNRIDFKGFYTAILEKNDEIISVASLRIHGTKLAEMPFIATSEVYRCTGMCKRLMSAIEPALCYLNVENLIIPSVPERIENWIGRYGFRNLEVSMKKEIMVHNTLMFHDSVRLQKTLFSSSHLATLRKPRSKAITMRDIESVNHHHGLIDKYGVSALLDLNLEPSM